MAEETKEMVNHPDHYHGISGKYECIDVMKNVFGQEMTESFCILNAFKYLYRCNAKGKRTEDLKKADWYIRYAVNNKEGDKKKMKKVFISQPMNGRTNAEIEEQRDAIMVELGHMFPEGYEVIDSFFKDAPHDANPIWFLGKSLELLSTADVAYFAVGWENARGCRIEYDTAYEYGLPCIGSIKIKG